MGVRDDSRIAETLIEERHVCRKRRSRWFAGERPGRQKSIEGTLETIADVVAEKKFSAAGHHGHRRRGETARRN